MYNMGDDTKIGRLLDNFWEGSSTITIILKVYIAGSLAYLTWVGLGYPLILMNYMMGWDNNWLLGLGCIVAFFNTITYLFIPKLFYDMLELCLVVIYYLLCLLILIIVVYLMYKTVIYGRQMNT